MNNKNSKPLFALIVLLLWILLRSVTLEENYTTAMYSVIVEIIMGLWTLAQLQAVIIGIFIVIAAYILRDYIPNIKELNIKSGSVSFREAEELTKDIKDQQLTESTPEDLGNISVEVLVNELPDDFVYFLLQNDGVEGSFKELSAIAAEALGFGAPNTGMAYVVGLLKSIYGKLIFNFEGDKENMYYRILSEEVRKLLADKIA